jgi:propionyl-CoA synthetase
VSASCGIEPTRPSPTSRSSTRRSSAAATSPSGASSCSAPVGGRTRRAGHRLGAGHGRAAEPVGCVEVEPPPIRSTSSTPPARPAEAQGHRARQRRARGRPAWSMANIYDIGPGETCGSPRRTSAGSSATPTSSTRRCSSARRPLSTRANRSAHPTRRVLADHRRLRREVRCSPPPRRTGRSRRRTRGLPQGGARPVGLRALFLAGERLDPDTYEWATDPRRPGRRQLVADRDRLADRGEPAGPRADADQAGLAVGAVPGYDVQVLDDTGQPVPAGQEGAIAIKLPLPPGTLPTLWQDDERYISSTCRSTTATTSPATAGSSTRTVTSTSWGAPTTCSTSRGTDCRPARSRPPWPGTRPSPSARSSAWPTTSRARSRAGWSCSRPASTPMPRARGSLKELVQRVRDEVGAVASAAQVDIVGGLPKTRSGKILRKTMREIADGDPGHDRGRERARP